MCQTWFNLIFFIKFCFVESLSLKWISFCINCILIWINFSSTNCLYLINEKQIYSRQYNHGGAPRSLALLVNWSASHHKLTETRCIPHIHEKYIWRKLEMSLNETIKTKRNRLLSDYVIHDVGPDIHLCDIHAFFSYSKAQSTNNLKFKLPIIRQISGGMLQAHSHRIPFPAFVVMTQTGNCNAYARKTFSCARDSFS